MGAKEAALPPPAGRRREIECFQFHLASLIAAAWPAGQRGSPFTSSCTSAGGCRCNCLCCPQAAITSPCATRCPTCTCTLPRWLYRVCHEATVVHAVAQSPGSSRRPRWQSCVGHRAVGGGTVTVVHHPGPAWVYAGAALGESAAHPAHRQQRHERQRPRVGRPVPPEPSGAASSGCMALPCSLASTHRSDEIQPLLVRCRLRRGRPLRDRRSTSAVYRSECSIHKQLQDDRWLPVDCAGGAHVADAAAPG